MMPLFLKEIHNLYGGRSKEDPWFPGGRKQLGRVCVLYGGSEREGAIGTIIQAASRRAAVTQTCDVEKRCDPIHMMIIKYRQYIT